MWKMVVVEDEPLILEGILQTFEWKHMGIEIAGAFSSALDALDHIIHNSPDILLTDIVMPERNGIWLIEQIKEIGLQVDVVLLTNHTDFHYARRALQLGAFDYVIKMDMYETLPQVVERVREHLRSRGSPPGEDRMERIARSLGRELEGGGMVLVEALNSGRTGALPIESAGLQIAGVPCRSHREYEALLRRIARGPAGGSWWDAAHPRPSLERAVKMYDLALLRGGRVVFSWETDNPTLMQCGREWQMELLALIHNGAVGVIPAFRRYLAQGVEARDVLAGRVKRTALEAWGELLPYFYTEDARLLHTAGREIFGQAASVMEMDRWLQAHQTELHRALELHFNSRARDIQEVVRYVDAICCTDVTLDVVARHFYLNPSYLSTQFKKACGKSFTDYLRGKRMERAARLCAGTDLPIQEIAGQVGYLDTKYFTRLFREQFGCLPSAYRNRMRK